MNKPRCSLHAHASIRSRLPGTPFVVNSTASSSQKIGRPCRMRRSAGQNPYSEHQIGESPRLRRTPAISLQTSTSSIFWQEKKPGLLHSQRTQTAGATTRCLVIKVVSPWSRLLVVDLLDVQPNRAETVGRTQDLCLLLERVEDVAYGTCHSATSLPWNFRFYLNQPRATIVSSNPRHPQRFHFLV
ncbi:hypothetical protein PISMIDRAFT_265478 [Pisolithus microcarpus 441]|uniref:Uncharacterized protein n=1 Tax=Pisolithus microcarpus 441 TaxID=765257 RepID=A0A0C9YIF8_9AGAM|nr:hypothetical protein PISMIDRAFT_265478 [Pisolithus microcarpus 441]